MKMQLSLAEGSPLPLGATLQGDEANFALFSSSAKSVTLLLIDPSSKKISSRIPLDVRVNKTGQVWHVKIKGVQLPLLYAYVIDRSAPLLDPYAKSLSTSYNWKQQTTAYSLLENEEPFDWQGISPPRLPLKDLIIYEMHVRGFTQHSSSHVKQPGTYLGLIEKIPHLLNLGINAVELMPIFEFDETRHPVVAELCNYWGYGSLHFFTPMHRFATSDAKQEFKTMVRELHKNGIEVILDVVYNHTAENPSIKNYLSLREIDHPVYYILQDNKDTNYSGCGNTLNCNHPVTKQFILDSLRYWATEMRVDGFRFDLAPILNREMNGALVAQSALVKELSLDHVLADKKLIAEPWDAASGYQLGGFFSDKNRWSEWNGKYRDVMRGFIKGDEGVKKEFANMITGSSWIFPSRTPLASINFITAHDGYSLYDMVSYNDKHNDNNGEGNKDGNNHEPSWNCGAEGPTNSTQIKNLRQRQMKNYLLALMISNGIPMLLMGDEYGHTKLGNNNSWCQDNELSWFLWDRLKKQSALFTFLKKLIHYRRLYLQLSKEIFLNEEEITWHGIEPDQPNWDDPKSVLGCYFIQSKNYAFFNATHDGIDIHLPSVPKGRSWHLIVNTFGKQGADIYDVKDAPPITSDYYHIPPYSAILLRQL